MKSCLSTNKGIATTYMMKMVIDGLLLVATFPVPLVSIYQAGVESSGDRPALAGVG